MILLERKDVERLGLWTYPFLVHWDPNDPEKWAEGNRLDFPDILADGPFLLVVNDEHAWAGQKKDQLNQVAQKRADPPNLRWWRALADMYAESMGISRQGFVLRFSAMKRRMRGLPSHWFEWDKIYDWPEGEDLMWSALVYGHHPWIKVREHEGRRQVRYTR